MKPTILCLLAVLACLTGCLPVDSLNPLYTDKDIVFDNTLLGDWVSVNKDNEESTLRFVTLAEKGKDNNFKDSGYDVTLFGKNQDGTCSSMEFTLTKLKSAETNTWTLSAVVEMPMMASSHCKSSSQRLEPPLRQPCCAWEQPHTWSSKAALTLKRAFMLRTGLPGSQEMVTSCGWTGSMTMISRTL